MIPTAITRGASPCLKGLVSSNRLLSAYEVLDTARIHTDFSHRQIVLRGSQLQSQGCSFSVSVPFRGPEKTQKTPSVSYFSEFFSAVSKEVETVSKDETLIKWQKGTDDPAAKKRAANKWVFLQVMEIYIKKNKINRRGHCEFIEEALGRMKELGLEREISCYKALFRAFPQNSMRVTNVWEEMMAHFPKQQTLAMEVMDQMARAGVIPDEEFAECVAIVFGTRSPTFKKVQKMLYWMTKFKYMNPYKLPHFLPGDEIELALLALKKMAIDQKNVNTVWKITDESLNNKESFVASAQSVEQQELLRKHPVDVPLYVEGGFLVWLRNKPQTYFILKAESDSAMFKEPTEEERHIEEGNVDEIETMFDSEESGAALAPVINQHHQEDGTIFAMCITGTSTKDSLITWIRHLQENNPSLEKTPIVFTLRSPEEDGLVMADKHEVTAQTT